MGNAGVIDQFLATFTRYIDSGFGLLGGEVAFVATTLIVIDVTLAALFWSWGADDDILARLVKKTLFVGVFAYLISNWNGLAQIVFESFSGLGLKASGTGFSAQDLLHPGKVAQTGLDAGRPLLEAISGLMGYVSFFENFIQIACLLFAWALVLLALLHFGGTALRDADRVQADHARGIRAGSFGLFGKTAFMAERVLGNVISSGIKVLVLAIVIGIGSTLFGEFTQGFGGENPTIDQAMAIVLAALSLLGLGIFGPGIANGLVAGGPQLGAGAAVGTGLAAGGMAVVGYGAAGLAARGGTAAFSGAMSAARGGTSLAGSASAAYMRGAAGQAGAAGIASGLGGIARASASAASSPLKRAAANTGQSLKSSFTSGASSSAEIIGGSSTTTGTIGGAALSAAAPASGAGTHGQPEWARRLQRSQRLAHGAQTAAHAVRAGDSHGGGASISLSEGK